MSSDDEVDSYFERERERLAKEITNGFEEVLLSTNVLNRKLEEVLGMTKEYATIAELWQGFYDLMHGKREGDTVNTTIGEPGLPGTGGHTLRSTGVGKGSEQDR